MVRHSLIQIPLLAISGALLVARRNEVGPNPLALPALLVALFTSTIWMLPRMLDASLSDQNVELAKIITIPLLIGILLAVASLASVIENLLHDQPEEMAGLFTGLIAGSVVIAWRLVRTWSPTNLAIVVGVSVAIFVVLGLREGTTDETVGQLTDPALWAFFGAGAIAVCAMILPGVSGSFLLVVLGMYGPVLEAVNDRDFTTLLVMIVGMTLGIKNRLIDS